MTVFVSCIYEHCLLNQEIQKFSIFSCSQTLKNLQAQIDVIGEHSIFILPLFVQLSPQNTVW